MTKQKKLLDSLTDKKYTKFVTNSFDLIHLVPIVAEDEDAESVDQLLKTSIYLMRVKHLLSNRFPLEAPIPPSWDINTLLPSVVNEVKRYNKKNILVFYILVSTKTGPHIPFDILENVYSYNRDCKYNFNYLL